MTKYVLQTPGSEDRVLFVRRQSAESKWYIVAHQPVYPNMDFEGGRIYAPLVPCRSAAKMQTNLDAFARALNLIPFEEKGSCADWL